MGVRGPMEGNGVGDSFSVSNLSEKTAAYLGQVGGEIVGHAGAERHGMCVNKSSRSANSFNEVRP